MLVQLVLVWCRVPVENPMVMRKVGFWGQVGRWEVVKGRDLLHDDTRSGEIFLGV